MLINNEEVTQKKVLHPDTKEILSIEYDYFACTCSDKDEEYFKKITQDMFPEFHKDESIKRRTTLMLRELAKYGWLLNGCGADMWMGASFTKPATETTPEINAYIQCDLFVYSLTSALMIAKNHID